MQNANRKHINKAIHLQKVIGILRRRGLCNVDVLTVELVRTIKSVVEEIKAPFVLNSYEIEYIWQKLLE
jgi:hypothetical protein